LQDASQGPSLDPTCKSQAMRNTTSNWIRGHWDSSSTRNFMKYLRLRHQMICNSCNFSWVCCKQNALQQMQIPYLQPERNSWENYKFGEVQSRPRKLNTQTHEADQQCFLQILWVNIVF
jgi:hypothetical protein